MIDHFIIGVALLDGDFRVNTQNHEKRNKSNLTKEKPGRITLRPIMVDQATAAELIGVSLSTVKKLIREEKFIKPREISPGRAGYLLRELEEWAESRPIANFLPVRGSSKGGKNRHANQSNNP